MPSRARGAADSAEAAGAERRHAERQLRKDLIISFLALVSVAIGIYDLARPRADARFTWLDIIDLFIVGIFIVDFAYSARVSGNWKRYARRHWYEIPSLIPVTGNMAAGAATVPILRGLRLVRLVRVFRLLRVVGAATHLEQFWRKSFRVARRARLGLLAVFTVLVITTGAALIWLFEAPTNPDIVAFEDALWWALNMFTNVAYVDFAVETRAGRLIAGILEFTGIAFIGLFTASLAGALLTDPGDEGRKNEKPLD